MLRYICACLVLFSVVKSDQVKNLQPRNENPTNDAPKQSEAIFADVIKNISRVNNVLQELINNYEQLQKIYKSQEDVESVYSDSEIDEVFKSNSNKKSKRTKNEKAVTKKANSEKFAATRMFWSDHDEDNDSSNNDSDEIDTIKYDAKIEDNDNSNNDSNEINTIKDDTKINDTIEPKLDLPATPTTTLKPVISEESSDESSDASLSAEKVIKHINKVKIPDKVKPASIPKPKPLQPQAEVIFVDTHHKPKETVPMKVNKEVKPKPKVEPSIQYFGMSRPKTRYSKVSYRDVKQPELQLQNPISKASKNYSRKVKRIIYSETFSPKKIWDDILSNKPIKLEAHNEVTMRRVDKGKRNQNAFDKRTKNNKSAIMITTKNKNKKNDNRTTISSENDEKTDKEELKTNVLRQAYGDACLKLVVRKCYKACQKVSKSVCNQVSCEGGVKASFKSYSKTGCIQEFQGGGLDQTQRRNTDTNTLSPIINYRRQTDNFLDMARGGFLSAACLPHVNVTEHKAILPNDTPSPKANPAHQFNILRDRFERACKKISSDKCIKACQYGYTKMCEAHTCSKRMTKTFEKQCKNKCRNAYELFSKDSDSDSDSDTDNSGSDDSKSSD